jgi:hypothetical protein
MVRPDENRTMPIREMPATMTTTAKKIEKNRGTWFFWRNNTIGSMTKDNNRAMVKGKKIEAVILNNAPPSTRAIKATRKKLALPELKLLNLSLIIMSMPY